MMKLLSFLGATAGGWVGWLMGARISIMAAFILGIIGTGVGMYMGRKFARDHY